MHTPLVRIKPEFVEKCECRIPANANKAFLHRFRTVISTDWLDVGTRRKTGCAPGAGTEAGKHVGNLI